MLRHHFIALFSGTSTLIACAGLSESSSADVTLDSAVVKSQTSALTTALTAAANDDGVSIATELASVGNTAAALIPKTNGASRSQLKGTASLASSTCKCTTASSKTCTFNACTIGSATTSGIISWANGKLVCTNLTFDVATSQTVKAEGQNVTVGATHVGVDCDFTYSTTSLAGTLHTTGTTEVQSVSYSWDATMTANDVTFSSKGFTAGSVDVAANVTTVSSAEGTDTLTVSGNVAFP